MGGKGKATKETKKSKDKKLTKEPSQGSPAAGAKSSNKVSREDRLQMIRTAAYHLAEKRGFQPGAEMDDWLEAEKDLKDAVSADPTDDI